MITFSTKSGFDFSISYEGFKFVVSPLDFETAPSPICTRLISRSGWFCIASELEALVIEQVDNGMDFNRIIDNVWERYESLVLAYKGFYYEDCTDEEINALEREDITRNEIFNIYMDIRDRQEETA